MWVWVRAGSGVSGFNRGWVLVGWVKPVGPLLVVFGLNCGVLCHRWCLRFHVGVCERWQWCLWFHAGARELCRWCLRFHVGVCECWQWRLRFHTGALELCRWRLRFRSGLGVGRLGETGGAFVGGFWAKLRCFVLSVVPAVSRGRARAVSVVPAVSCGRVRVLAVASPVSCGRVRALAVVPVVLILSPWFFWVSII